jgi:hypothetical protein
VGIKINTMLIVLGLIVALAFFITLYLLLRDSPSNNLRRARKYHMQGQKKYSQGKYEQAKLDYEIAKHYRERALKKGEK